MPVGASSFSEALRVGAEIFHALRGILKKRGLATGVGDEGGFAPNLKSNQDALDVVMEAIGKAGQAGDKNSETSLDRPADIAVDTTANEVYVADGGAAQRVIGSTPSGRRTTRSSRSRTASEGRLARLGAADEGARRQRAAGRRDVFVTARDPQGRHCQGHRQLAAREGQPDRHGHRDAAGDGERGARARRSRRTAPARPRIRRSPTSRDARAGQIKTGSLCRSDRVAKYNQLLRIEEALGSSAKYAGRAALKQLK